MVDVRFVGVTKRFERLIAIDRLDLAIADGELMVILGPSGCGKSTVLRLIAGLEEPDDGQVMIGDEVVNDVTASDRDVAMVFQSYALYPHMTVRRNIEFPLRPARLPERERRQRVQDAAEVLGLVPLLDRKPRQLSGGERQRVAMARALVRRPQVFLMDEPMSNLDAQLRTQTRGQLVALHRRLGTTTIMVTHDQVEATAMADRVALMVGGRLLQVGTPEDLRQRPADLTVARFMGTPPMNLLPGGLLADRLGVAVADDVVVGIQPEWVSLAPADAGGLPGVVTSVESLGPDHLVWVEVERGSAAPQSVVVRLGPRDLVPGADEPVTIAVDHDRLVLFDAVTTRRVA